MSNPIDIRNELGLTLNVSHFPSGTSKWNIIEHRLFSFISKNWRGQPFICLFEIVNLISETKTESGLTAKCVIDYNEYKKGIEVSDDELAKINLVEDDFHGEWNYSIVPNMLSILLVVLFNIKHFLNYIHYNCLLL